MSQQSRRSKRDVRQRRQWVQQRELDRILNVPSQREDQQPDETGTAVTSDEKEAQ